MPIALLPVWRAAEKKGTAGQRVQLAMIQIAFRRILHEFYDLANGAHARGARARAHVTEF